MIYRIRPVRQPFGFQPTIASYVIKDGINDAIRIGDGASGCSGWARASTILVR